MAATGGRSRAPARVARSVLAWACVCFVALHTAVHAYLEHRHPEVYDPEFGARLAVLRARLEEKPERPLLLVVGSSRLVTDFLPERLPPLACAEGEVLPFNFSHTGAGPLINLMEIRRLFRAGVRPRWLVVEVLPPMLNTSGRSTAAHLALADDLPLLCRHMPAWKAYGRYLGARVVPSTRHYLTAVRDHGPDWAFASIDAEFDDLGPLGGSTPLKHEASPELVEHATNAVRAQYFPGLQHFQVTDVADRSLRDLIELCRTENVELVLVLAPESSEFRGWYAEHARQAIDGYCAKLRRSFGVPVVDARAWLADADFFDAHHAIPRGAEVFTRRLGRDVLEPLVRGQQPIE